MSPGQCAVCRSWATQAVCTGCLNRYASSTQRCWTCGLRIPGDRAAQPEPRCGQCLHTPPPLDRCIAALDYAFPWDGLLQRYKFNQALELRRALSDRLAEALAVARPEIPDLLLPVPLAPERLRERGYNQSLELAAALARQYPLQCEPSLLLRVRHGSPQAQLEVKARAAHVRHAFALEPARAASLRGRSVAVLDDVMTSGETLFEIARVLRQAGASHIQAWVLARTPQPGTDQP
ncbi:ComF family protein [Roseateles koreensis]|uniref:ComF family protein n=1 Tax=Roseateles koreensis TaxID=2987526 RepID=UPI0023591572